MCHSYFPVILQQSYKSHWTKFRPDLHLEIFPNPAPAKSEICTSGTGPHNTKNKTDKTRIQLLTFAVSVAMPRPTSLLRANALATHEVIVSGAVTCIVTWPSALLTDAQQSTAFYYVQPPPKQHTDYYSRTVTVFMAEIAWLIQWLLAY